MASTIKSNTIDTVDNTALTIKQNDTTAITIDTSQNVGIGTTSPNSPQATNLHISGTSSAIRMSDTSNSMTANLYASGGEFEILTSTSHPIVFKTANSERMRLSSDGLHLGGTGSANALDDYEEGTWTPTLETTGTNFSSVGYANRIGSYTKIGRLVLAPFYVQLNSLTIGSPSGNVQISGLPFTSLSNSANKASIVAYVTNLNYGLAGFNPSSDSINVGANVIHNTTNYQITRTRNNSTPDGIPYQALTSSSFAIVGTAIYDTN